MISSLLHLVGLRPRVYYTLTNFRGGGQGPLGPLPQYANDITDSVFLIVVLAITQSKIGLETKLLFF